MLLDFFKKRPSYVQVDGDNRLNKKKKLLIFIIVAAIVMLVLSGNSESENKSEKKTGEMENSVGCEEYIKENERRLEEILAAVKNAGDIKVMITVEEVGEKVIATDKKSESTQETAEEKSSRSTKQEDAALVFGSGNEEKPFVVKEKLPKASGVLVVASGAENESVRLEIYEAVRALYGISGHRIKITTGNIKQ